MELATKTDRSAKPRLPLSKERVLRAAINLADESGLKSLSMRKLGQELGVEAMSLYNHVANKDDILDGIVDIVVSDIDLPSNGPAWKTAMRKWAISAREVLLRHPWACSLIVSRPRVDSAWLRYFDSAFGSLRDGGFSIEMAHHAWHALDSHILGFTLQELNSPFEGEIPEVAAMFPRQVPTDEYPYITEYITEVFMDSGHDDDFEFEFGLDLILDALERVRYTA
jgi:AcrR family transcriptional regulator